MWQQEIEDVIGLEAHDAPRISAKTGLNVEEVLEAIVQKIPAPKGDPEAPLQALIFDSLYDSYKGVIVFCRVKEGTVKKGTPHPDDGDRSGCTRLWRLDILAQASLFPCDELSAGMVGYITASIKNVQDTRVGDTITDQDNPCAEPLPGYKKVTPMVYCGLYPADGAKYPDLRDALEKLQLNDASLFFEPETSVALGFGFRCGFSGTSASGDHPGASGTRVQPGSCDNGAGRCIPGAQDERRDDRADEPVQSAGSVRDRLHGRADRQRRDHGDHRICRCDHDSCARSAAAFIWAWNILKTTVRFLKYELPLNEIIYDFFDALKSRSRGYASFDYELKGYEQF